MKSLVCNIHVGIIGSTCRPILYMIVTTMINNKQYYQYILWLNINLKFWASPFDISPLHWNSRKCSGPCLLAHPKNSRKMWCIYLQAFVVILTLLIHDVGLHLLSVASSWLHRGGPWWWTLVVYDAQFTTSYHF